MVPTLPIRGCERPGRTDDAGRAAAFRLLRGTVAALRDDRPTDATG